MELKTVELESMRTEIEKVMMGMSPDLSEGERRSYLAGFVDGLYYSNRLCEENRDILYAEYSF